MKKSYKCCLYFVLVFLAISFIGFSSEAKTRISNRKITLIVSQKKQISLFDNTQKIKWTSSNKSIATVDKKGTIKGKRAGKTVITASVGDKTAY